MDAKDFKHMSPYTLKSGEGLRLMVTKQNILLQHYMKIEGFPEPPWEMSVKANQIEIKGFMFRIIEELAEAYESFKNGDEDNFHTELADATHFILELGIVTGIPMSQEDWDVIWIFNPPEIENPEDYEIILVEWFWRVTYHIGLLSNMLRNKQWKVTEVRPDLTQFRNQFAVVYNCFFAGFRMIEETEQTVFNWYYWKNEANKFRIESKY